jgi:hypothetical protein
MGWIPGFHIAETRQGNQTMNDDDVTSVTHFWVPMRYMNSLI